MTAGRSAFLERFNPTPDVCQRLDAYAALLEKWQKTINLVSRGTLDNLWRRHLWDSAQLLDLIPDKAAVVADLGSGGGLPGLILAAMSDCSVHSIESDQRKIAFQRQAVLAMDLTEKVVLHNIRVEEVRDVVPSVITARAFAPLQKLLDLGYPLSKKDTQWILPKGQNVEAEIEEATKCWTFSAKCVHSETQSGAQILCLQGVMRR